MNSLKIQFHQKTSLSRAYKVPAFQTVFPGEGFNMFGQHFPSLDITKNSKRSMYNNRPCFII
jgi:hypothetical protein